MLRVKDYFLFALAFISTSLFTFMLQWTFVRGEYPEFTMYSMTVAVFVFLAISFVIAGIVKHITEK